MQFAPAGLRIPKPGDKDYPEFLERIRDGHKDMVRFVVRDKKKGVIVTDKKATKSGKKGMPTITAVVEEVGKISDEQWYRDNGFMPMINDTLFKEGAVHIVQSQHSDLAKECWDWYDQEVVKEEDARKNKLGSLIEELEAGIPWWMR